MEIMQTPIATDPFEYKGSTDAELGYGSESTETWFEEYAPEHGRRMGVFAAQPKHYGSIGTNSPELTIIMSASHDYRLEPLWMRRMEIIANKMDARVIGVDTPGTTGLLKGDGDGGFEVYTDTKKIAAATQTLAEYKNALIGDFSLHAKDELEAIDSTIGLDPNRRYAILGESMGAAVATDMITLMKERGLQVSDIILYELVNGFKGSRPKLPLQLMKVLPGIENDRRNQYIAENTAIGHAMTAFELSGGTDEERAYNKKLDGTRKALSQQGIASAINGLGMMRGRFDSLLDSLEMYSQKEAPLVTLIRGADSLAAKKEDYDTFQNALREQGAHIGAIEVTDRSSNDQEIGHSHLVSLGRQAQVADELKNRIS